MPSTKVRRPAPQAPFAWAYTYTAFSLDFARAALDQLGARPGLSVLDPFVGSGTTMLAAGMRGCHALGVDVSPFSALLSRARLASSVDPERVRTYLAATNQIIARPAQRSEVLEPEDIAYAEAVIDRMCCDRKLPRDRLWSELLADGSGAYDSEAVTLLSLAIAAKDCARVQKGSNPIWYRRLPEAEHYSRKTALQPATHAWSLVIAEDLLNAAPIHRKEHRIANADFLSLTYDSEFDIFLTSPPYLNRLDYVIAHLPELSVLRLVTSISHNELRASMVGTTKMVAKYTESVPREWGDLCNRTLSAILHHPSYASSRYYYHTFCNYFQRLYNSIASMARLMHSKSQGIIVLQDSFYKDINIPTPQISVEMLQSCSCFARIVQTKPVRTHMGRMSPRQSLYAPQKTLGESVVCFSKGQS